MAKGDWHPGGVVSHALPAVVAAIAHARSAPDRHAYAVVARPVALEAEPLAAFAAAPRGRTLLWDGDGWLLAIGAAERVACSGPGRGALMAYAAARLEAACA